LKFVDLFRKKKAIFYHEDDFLQIEILPRENYPQLKAESEKVDAFSRENFDGTGFTDIYVRDDNNKVELNQRDINKKDVEQILSSLGMDRITTVMTGYGQSYRQLHHNCIAFGKEYHAVYFDFKGEIVQHIWITQPWMIGREKLVNCLYDIGVKWDLVLHDWNNSETIDLTDKNAIINYLRFDAR
jgi:hypothetical protein